MCLLTMMLSLSKNHSIRKSRPSRADMNRSSTSEIQGRKLVEPTIAVPCPACDGAVNDCGPEEAEDQ
jgi:hypothetical protein